MVSLNRNTALVESATNITHTGPTAGLAGYQAIADLKGRQQGQFKADTETGLLVNGKSTTSLKGIIQVVGREVPVSIKMTMEITAKKI